MNYNFPCKIHPYAAQQISSLGEKELETYRYYLLLHSIYKNKVIKDYEKKISFIEKYSGFSEYRQKKYNNLLIEGGYAYVQNNNLHLLGRNFVCEKFGFIDNEELYGKFVSLHPLDVKDKYKFKAIILEFATNKKKFAAVEEFVEKNNFGLDSTNKFKKGNNYLISKRVIEETFNLNIKTDLSLNEIKTLFGLKTIQGASMFIKKLESKQVISSFRMFKKIREMLPGENYRLFSDNRFIVAHEGNNIPIIYEETFKKIGFKTNVKLPKSKYVKLLERIEKKRVRPASVFSFKNDRNIGISISNKIINKTIVKKIKSDIIAKKQAGKISVLA